MSAQPSGCCFSCGEPVSVPAVLARANGRPVACLCARCAGPSAAGLRRFAAFVRHQYGDYYQIDYSSPLEQRSPAVEWFFHLHGG